MAQTISAQMRNPPGILLLSGCDKHLQKLTNQNNDSDSHLNKFFSVYLQLLVKTRGHLCFSFQFRYYVLKKTSLCNNVVEEKNHPHTHCVKSEGPLGMVLAISLISNFHFLSGYQLSSLVIHILNIDGQISVTCIQSKV